MTITSLFYNFKSHFAKLKTKLFLYLDFSINNLFFVDVKYDFLANGK